MKLEIRDISYSYGQHAVLKKISAEAFSGDVTAIAGCNGVGKTTLLKCIAKLLKPSEGKILYNNQNISAYSGRELARLQAYVPQNTMPSFPLTVEEYVSLGRKPYVEWSLKEHDLDVIEQNMQYMGITEYRGKLLNEISGGERQRVLLTRALVQEPKILLLDEPTSALDIHHQLEVMLLLRKIAVERDCVVMIVMHDLTLINRFTDRVILLENGALLSEGSTADVLTPANLRTAYRVETDIIPTSHGTVIIPYAEEAVLRTTE